MMALQCRDMGEYKGGREQMKKVESVAESSEEAQGCKVENACEGRTVVDGEQNGCGRDNGDDGVAEGSDEGVGYREEGVLAVE